MQQVQSKTSRGFSLIEVLLVLVLIATMAGIAVSFMSGSLEKARIQAVSKDLLSALKYTRGQAVIKHEQSVITFNVEEKTYQAPKKKAVKIPDEIDINLYTASSDIVDDKVGRIRFFSDGSSTGGWVKLTYGKKIWKINVNWLTGEIRMEEGAS